MKRTALRPHQIRHDHIQDRRHRTADDRPLQIGTGGRHGFRVRPKQIQNGLAQHCKANGEHDPAQQCTIKSKRGAAPHRVIFPLAQRPAHHTGAAHSKKVIHRVECQQHRGGQRDRRVFNRVIQHPHKIGVRQIVDDHHQTAEDRGDGQREHRLGNSHFFKKLYFSLLNHAFYSSKRAWPPTLSLRLPFSRSPCRQH